MEKLQTGWVFINDAYESFTKILNWVDTTQMEAWYMYLSLGKIYTDLRDFPKADKHLDKAEQLALKFKGESSVELVEVYTYKCRKEWFLVSMEKADLMWEKAYLMAEQELDPNHSFWGDLYNLKALLISPSRTTITSKDVKEMEKWYMKAFAAYPEADRLSRSTVLTSMAILQNGNNNYRKEALTLQVFG